MTPTTEELIDGINLGDWDDGAGGQTPSDERLAEIREELKRAQEDWKRWNRVRDAAPDLLAALKDAMRSSRKDFKAGPDGDRQHREAYAEQFAALSKAEAR